MGKHGLIVFKFVLWRVIGFKTEDITGDWTTLHSEELRNLYSSPNIILYYYILSAFWTGAATLSSK
jgi:hypothetical protein